MNEINIIILNTFAYLRGVIFNLSNCATCFDINYEFYVYLKTKKTTWDISINYEYRPNISLK